MLTQKILTRLEKESTNAASTTGNGNILQSIMSRDIEYIHMPIKNEYEYFEQGKTGYCWLSSTLFCISQYLKYNHGIEYTAFSKSYLIFYDKLEKANYFLDLIIKYATYDMRDRNVLYILNNTMTDKGQWNMARNLILKYGMVPYDCMPDNTSQISTRELNACLNYLLKCHAINIRKMCKKSVDKHRVYEEKERALQQIYKLLIMCFGVPPRKVDIPKEFEEIFIQMSPKDFFDIYIKFPFENYISTCCIGDNYYVNYKIDLDGNVAEGYRNKFLSLPEKIFDSVIKEQINTEHFCWYSCDAGKFYIKELSLFDDTPFDLKRIMGDSSYKFFNRKEIFQHHIASPTHAMVFIDEVQKKDKMFYISYDSSKKSFLGPYCCVSDTWYKNYVFQAVVNKVCLSKEVDSTKIYTKKVKPWDFFYMG